VKGAAREGLEGPKGHETSRGTEPLESPTSC